MMKKENQMNNYRRIGLSRYQNGLSLVELMVSMLVGLFLLAGVVTNFVGTKNADKKRQALSEMDSTANYALSVLRTTVSHAGYSSINRVDLNQAFHTQGTAPNPSCGGGGTGNNVVWTDTIDVITRDRPRNDQLTVIALADNPCLPGNNSCANPAQRNPAALVYTDCVGGGDLADTRVVSCSTDQGNGGMQRPSDAKIYSSFTLMINQSSPNNRVLSCQGSRGGTQPIAENVEAIQYKYGVKNESQQVRFRTANQVQAAGQWGMVTSVKVGLLMRSSDQFLLDRPSTTASYDLLGRTISIAPDDRRRLFKKYITTINLENLNKEPIL